MKNFRLIIALYFVRHIIFKQWDFILIETFPDLFEIQYSIQFHVILYKSIISTFQFVKKRNKQTKTFSYKEKQRKFVLLNKL